MNLKSTLVAITFCAVGLLTSAAYAEIIEAEFPAAGTSYSSATDGSGTIPSGGQSQYMWTTGDFVTATFSGTGLASVTSFSDTFDIIDLVQTGNTLIVDALVNGVDVGSFVVNDCSSCGTQVVNFNSGPFGPIFGAGTYTLAFVLENTLPSGGGSIAFLDGGVATLSSSSPVPEPSTWALMLLGFAGLGLAAYRRAFQKSSVVAG